MANLLKDHVWIIDTATGSTLIDRESARVQTVRWIGTAAGAGGAEIANGNGDVVWAARTAAGEVSDESHGLDFRLVNGFSVPTLLAGTKLYLYLDLTPGA